MCRPSDYPPYDTADVVAYDHTRSGTADVLPGDGPPAVNRGSGRPVGDVGLDTRLDGFSRTATVPLPNPRLIGYRMPIREEGDDPR